MSKKPFLRGIRISTSQISPGAVIRALKMGVLTGADKRADCDWAMTFGKG